MAKKNGCGSMLLGLLVFGGLMIGLGVFALKSCAESADRRDAETPPPPGLTQTLYHEDVSDTPGKTQIIQRFVVTGDLTPDKLRAALVHDFGIARARQAFRYHPKATRIQILLFKDATSAAQLAGLQVAVLNWVEGEGEPDVTVSESATTSPAQAP